MKPIAIALGAGGLALAAMPALAQEAAAGPMATAGAAVPLAGGEAPPAPLNIDQSGQEDQPPDASERKIHGFVQVGVGTGGYREAAVAVDAPLPDGGEVSLAVRTVQGGVTRAPRHLVPPVAD